MSLPPAEPKPHAAIHPHRTSSATRARGQRRSEFRHWRDRDLPPCCAGWRWPELRPHIRHRGTLEERIRVAEDKLLTKRVHVSSKDDSARASAPKELRRELTCVIEDGPHLLGAGSHLGCVTRLAAFKVHGNDEEEPPVVNATQERYAR